MPAVIFGMTCDVRKKKIIIKTKHKNAVWLDKMVETTFQCQTCVGYLNGSQVLRKLGWIGGSQKH